MKIEELIKRRKDQLDVATPPPEVWANISSEWKQPEAKTFQWWKVAAIVFVCLSLGLLIQNQLLQSKVDELARLGDLSEQYAEIETNYITEVSLLESSTSIDSLRDNLEYQWVFEELQILEEINTTYRADIGKVQEELLVEVLIDYYEKKIRLLRKLELEIERNSNRRKNENTETTNIRT